MAAGMTPMATGQTYGPGTGYGQVQDEAVSVKDRMSMANRTLADALTRLQAIQGLPPPPASPAGTPPEYGVETLASMLAEQAGVINDLTINIQNRLGWL